MPTLAICALGDSFVEGIGDPTPARLGAGWVGRLATRTLDVLAPTGTVVRLHDLGMRGQTTREIAARAGAQLHAAVEAADLALVVCSYGTNDAYRQVDPAETAEAADEILAAIVDAADRVSGHAVLWVAPPPVVDLAVDERTDALARTLTEGFDEAGAVLSDPRTPLRAEPGYLARLAELDGAHPDGTGYDQIATLVDPAWRLAVNALSTPPARGSSRGSA